MNARSVLRAAIYVIWVLAFAAPIIRLVQVSTGRSMGRADQIFWLALILGWTTIGLMNSSTIAIQRKTIDRLENRQAQRDRAWLS